MACSRCGKGVSGRHPRSMTSAPSAAKRSAWARISSTVSRGASTISAKIRTSYRLRSAGLPSSPKYRGRSINSSGPRLTGIPKWRVSAATSPRQRPGIMIQSAPCVSVSRRSIICAVIRAATLTPIWRTDQVRSGSAIRSRIRLRGRSASWPVRKRMCSLIESLPICRSNWMRAAGPGPAPRDYAPGPRPLDRLDQQRGEAIARVDELAIGQQEKERQHAPQVEREQQSHGRRGAPQQQCQSSSPRPRSAGSEMHNPPPAPPGRSAPGPRAI